MSIDSVTKCYGTSSQANNRNDRNLNKVALNLWDKTWAGCLVCLRADKPTIAEC